MKLNELPVKTYRWLNVNEYIFEDVLEYKKFKGRIEITSDNDILIKNSLDVDTQYFDKTEEESSFEMQNYINENFNSGVFIHAKKSHQIPVKIDFKVESDDLLIDKNIIIADENSNITIIFNYEGAGKSNHFGITKIFAKKNSIVNIIKVQRLNDSSTHIDTVLGYADDGANIKFIQVEVGAKNAITNYFTRLNGFSSSSDIKAIYFGDKERVLDLSYKTYHIGRKTKGNIEVKGALKDDAKKIFKGTLDFVKGCKMSKGSEEEYTILLSKDAKSDSVPLLLCSEDDVEGAHAASTGKLDENKLFYIMSRGFTENQAKLLLIEASLKPVIDLIPDEKIREEIWNSIEGRIDNV
ncbi:FeS cluster assembly protein SufB [Caloramator mitchellensis]|uniref:FeS cluster assembly protein SufB n=1 Tax=Caloramator mitchellensis TaxID=908809 RepID=A0A0R3JS75_CALMK|nr:Fe-S cluster assembly protein SufD [Caloramator mitchellensis]KRQ86352.1 FeS cluster assembly protein SufB [Caloramator mitchellensis]